MMPGVHAPRSIWGANENRGDGFLEVIGGTKMRCLAPVPGVIESRHFTHCFLLPKTARVWQ